MTYTVSFLLMCLGILTAASPAQGHREMFTPEEKERLKAAEHIHVEALALTARGRTDAAGIATIATERLQDLGYRVTTDAAGPQDVTVKIKCEEHKTWEGTVTSGGDADQVGAAARLWKGPACQIAYRLGAHPADWRHEVRGAVPPAAPPAPAEPVTADPVLADLQTRLADDPFPYLLTAAWNQPARLLHALDNPATTGVNKQTIIALLGNMSAVDAIPALTRTLEASDPALAQSAAVALGAIGDERCIPVLLTQLDQEQDWRRRAAIRGLGRLAPLHPNSEIVPALLVRLPKEPVPVQTDIVRALGTTTDRRILEPLRALNRSVQERTRSDSSPELKELKRALGQALDQFDGVHTDE